MVLSAGSAILLASLPWWRTLEPYAEMREDSPLFAVMAGHLVLLVVSLLFRRPWLSALSLVHSGWLVAAVLAHSSVGEIWSFLQWLASNGSAVAVAGLSGWQLWGRTEQAEHRAAYATRLSVFGLTIFALLQLARGAYDAGTWFFIHRDAVRATAYLEAQPEAGLADFPFTYEWIRPHIKASWRQCSGANRPAQDRDGTEVDDETVVRTEVSVRYHVATSSTSHWYSSHCGESAGSWFYYPD